MTKTIDELHEDVKELIDNYELEAKAYVSRFTISMEGNADEGDDLEVTTMQEGDELTIVIERGYKQRGTEGEGEDLEYIYDANYEGSDAYGSYAAYAKFLKANFPSEYKQLMEDYGHVFDK